MNFGQKVLHFHQSLPADWILPKGFDLLYPFSEADTLQAMESFYGKYFSDERPRIFLLGINPGRFGAGVTGIAFTDPVHLQDSCGIANPFQKRHELSSIFVYEIINAFGGPDAFYRHCYISSVCPLGFTRDGINCNYYDDRQLQNALEPHIIQHLKEQIAFGCTGSTALCLGMGKNYKYLHKLNKRTGLFKEVRPLPHPRWVMQYRRKRMGEFIDQYLSEIQALLPS